MLAQTFHQATVLLNQELSVGSSFRPILPVPRLHFKHNHLDAVPVTLVKIVKIPKKVLETYETQSWSRSGRLYSESGQVLMSLAPDVL